MASPTEPSAPSAAPAVADLITELVARWTDGECPPVEELFDQYPELWHQPENAVHLICEEICLREEHGLPVDSLEIMRRFPQWRDQLAVLLECHQLLQPAAPPLFPEVGESIAGFHLLAELGRGLQGRVFLATQPALADRAVVLKITPCDGQEHLSLARLQHTYIAPLYLSQDEADRNLRLLCMPFFGGGPLSQVLDTLSEIPPAKRTGHDLLAAVDAAQKDLPLTAPARGPARAFLSRADYVQAICWIGACLAEALHYAHERGLVHLDVKPSNVLLAADAQPMLLDFHLAQPPLSPDAPLTDWLGGTAAFMSPEQQAAFDAISQARPIPARVDQRLDIFSLGRLLYEALGGTIPEEGNEPLAPLRRANSQVSAGLEDIINHCLSPAPEDRYPDAAALAADLRRHLIDQPLKGVPNRSWIERWHKWRRSKPHALKVIVLRLAVLVALGIAAVTSLLPVWHRIQEAEKELSEGQEFIRNHKYSEAEQRAKQGRERIAGLPFQEHLFEAFDRQIEAAKQGQSAEELHTLADNLRLLFDAAPAPGSDLRGLASHCRATWEARHRLATPSDADLATQQQADLLDLAILWADLHVRLAATDDADAARREALKVLADAETTFGPSPVLFRERESYAEALGDATTAQAARAVGRRSGAADGLGALRHRPPAAAQRRPGDGPGGVRASRASATAGLLVELRAGRLRVSPASAAEGRCQLRHLHRLAGAAASRDGLGLLLLQPRPGFRGPATPRRLCATSTRPCGSTPRWRWRPSIAACCIRRRIDMNWCSTTFAGRSPGAPLPAECHYQIVLVHLDRKDMAAARESLREALRSDPSHRGAAERWKEIGGAKR